MQVDAVDYQRLCGAAHQMHMPHGILQRVEQSRPETNFPICFNPGDVWVQAEPGNSALYCVAMQDEDTERLALRLVPCSCGTTFSVAEDYDRQGTHLRSFLVCPNCGKRHDPKNRLLRIGYERAGYWKVDDC